jgi:dihydrodipicolinate synthase/N-acetylneuraminate lyase
VSLCQGRRRHRGRSAGKVRPPLADPTPEEVEKLRALIAQLGPQA